MNFGLLDVLVQVFEVGDGGLEYDIEVFEPGEGELLFRFLEEFLISDQRGD